MCSEIRVRYSLVSTLYVVCLSFACITIELSSLICAQPMASVSLFSPVKGNLEGNETPTDPAELSFQQFINSNSRESTIIGELKPNASALEQLMSKNKIAETISSMQETDKQAKKSVLKSISERPLQDDCYIEVTRVEKVAGKCHRASGGLPICQSENYMTFSNDCS